MFISIMPINNSVFDSNQELEADVYSQEDIVEWWNSNWKYRYKLKIQDANDRNINEYALTIKAPVAP